MALRYGTPSGSDAAGVRKKTCIQPANRAVAPRRSSQLKVQKVLDLAAPASLPNGAAMPLAPSPEGLIARLQAAKLLDEAGLARARTLAAGGAVPLHLVLSRLGLVAERDLAEALAAELGLAVVAAAGYPAAPVLPEQLGERFLREAMVLPLAVTETGLELAMVDPFDRFARDAVAVAAGRPILPKVALAAELEAALTRLYQADQRDQDQLAAAGGELDEDIARLRDRASEAPVIRLANSLIDRAVAERASDIHIEPGPHGLDLRFRIDGRLRQVEAPPKALHLPLLSRLKLMAKLDIAERRLPQDGRIRIVSGGREIDLRIATMPGSHGESMVLRLLDRSAVRLELESLGYGDAALATINALLQRRSGIILVTGPTGAGKTTTLYAALRMLATPDVKVMSVEDPIEYHLDGITQIQVKPAIGLTFATALRSILRHDPDIIMVGEIRDRETAEIAIQAALTGHLVLSTLHTNSAVATIHRLLDMGIADYLIAPTLVGVIAQRLVRRLCPDCARPAPDGWRQRVAGGDEAAALAVHEPVGCPACHGLGYRGRVAVSEILALTEPLRQQILRRGSPHELQAAAAAAGMVTLRQDGFRKVVAGLTTVEEVLRLGLEDAAP
jgi:general secretion pathway protein E